MATSYFRQRARNPYLIGDPILEDARTQENPTASPLSPTFSRPTPMAPVVTEAPARAVAPTVAPSPAEVIEKEREAYAAGAPTTTKGRILQALAGAGLGFLRGAASNRDDPLGAGIGGAAAGGAISAVSPRAGRSMQFEMTERPRIEERLRGEEDKRKRTIESEDRARTISMDNLKRRESEADIDLKKSQAQRNRMPEYRATAPDRRNVVGDDGQPVIADLNAPENKGKTFRPYVRPPAPARPSRVPNEAYEREANLNELRQNAIDWWTKWGKLPEGSKERADAEKQASSAQANYNAAVEQFGTTFGEWFETGPSDSGWHYVKPRRGQPQGAAPPARSSQPTANLIDLQKRFWRD